MTVQMIFLPMFVQILLVFGLMFVMGGARRRAVASHEVDLKAAALSTGAWPDYARKSADSFSNQFQLPVLFYVLTICAYELKKADLVFVILAWVFVVTRFIQAYIHCTDNAIAYRGGAYLAGALVLMIMWVIFMVRVLLNTY